MILISLEGETFANEAVWKKAWELAQTGSHSPNWQYDQARGKAIINGLIRTLLEQTKILEMALTELLQAETNYLEAQRGLIETIRTGEYPQSPPPQKAYAAALNLFSKRVNARELLTLLEGKEDGYKIE